MPRHEASSGSSPRNINSSPRHNKPQGFTKVAVRTGLAALLALAVLHAVQSPPSTTFLSYLDLQSETSPSSSVEVRMNTLKRPLESSYVPAPVEAWIMEHTVQLGFNARPPNLVVTCTLWKDRNASPYHHQLQQFYQELKEYYRLLNEFRVPDAIQDVRYTHSEDGEDVCNQLELHPQGLPGIFQSQQLSQTSSGYVEPLIPPMRHPALCVEEGVGDPDRQDLYPQLVQLRYLVHDWAAICRKLSPTSRTVLVDMGASLAFHTGHVSPTLVLLEQYRRFGIKFDHIYAYEMNLHDPAQVQEAIPNQFRSAFHWINVAVDAGMASRNNPWNLLLDNFNPDDFIVVKMDIDGAQEIEQSLAEQLLENPRLLQLVDHFYFEHHVNQWELWRHWGPTTYSVEESFQLFHTLRLWGVSSHFWV